MLVKANGQSSSHVPRDIVALDKPEREVTLSGKDLLTLSFPKQFDKRKGPTARSRLQRSIRNGQPSINKQPRLRKAIEFLAVLIHSFPRTRLQRNAQHVFPTLTWGALAFGHSFWGKQFNALAPSFFTRDLHLDKDASCLNSSASSSLTWRASTWKLTQRQLQQLRSWEANADFRPRRKSDEDGVALWRRRHSTRGLL